MKNLSPPTLGSDFYKKLSMVFLLFMSAFIFGGRAQSEAAAISLNMTVDWQSGAIDLEVSRQILDRDQIIKKRHIYELEVQHRLAELITDGFSALIVNSLESFGDLMEKQISLYDKINNLANGARPVSSVFSEDFSALKILYRFTLWSDLIDLIIDSNRLADAITPALAYEPSADFTGIVIYAAHEMPVFAEQDEFGRTQTAFARPCLLPRLLGPGLEEIVAYRHLDGSILRRWGVAAYTETSNLSELRDRVGEKPLYVYAQGVYGKYRTDLILPDISARMIMTRSQNIELLSQGKIAIIHNKQ